MALGSAEVRPIDMASAYATLADLGEYNKPTFFEGVDHRSGRPVIGRAAQARARGLGRVGLAGQRHPQGRHHRRHRHRGQHRPSRRRQDRHQPGLPRCLVRRLHPAARGGGVDGQSQGQESMYDVAGRRVSGGSFGPGLARLHGRGRGQPGGPGLAGSRRRSSPTRSFRRPREEGRRPGRRRQGQGPEAPEARVRPAKTTRSACRTSTTRPAPRCGEPWRRCCRRWSANRQPVRPARPGRGGADRGGDAREQVAALVGAAPAEVVFTSGGTEADNLAVKGTVLDLAAGGPAPGLLGRRAPRRARRRRLGRGRRRGLGRPGPGRRSRPGRPTTGWPACSARADRPGPR